MRKLNWTGSGAATDFFWIHNGSGRSVGRSIDRSVGRSVGQSVGWSVTDGFGRGFLAFVVWVCVKCVFLRLLYVRVLLCDRTAQSTEQLL